MAKSKVTPGKSAYERGVYPFGYESGERKGSGAASFFGGSLKNDNTGNKPVDKGHSKPSL
jgi:hypothetical protein